jgi:hypothetical protein
MDVLRLFTRGATQDSLNTLSFPYPQPMGGANVLKRCERLTHGTIQLSVISAGPRTRLDGFGAWFEVYLEGRRFTFDARHNCPRIGHIVIARGRNVAIYTSFGSTKLTGFNAVTREVINEGLEIPFRQASVA